MNTYILIYSSELDEDVGGCDDNFVKLTFSNDKTGESCPVTIIHDITSILLLVHDIYVLCKLQSPSRLIVSLHHM
jgi:hypothetical protein